MKKKNLAVANSFKESFFKVLIDIFLLTGNKSLKMQWIFFFFSLAKSPGGDNRENRTSRDTRRARRLEKMTIGRTGDPLGGLQSIL